MVMGLKGPVTARSPLSKALQTLHGAGLPDTGSARKWPHPDRPDLYLNNDERGSIVFLHAERRLSEAVPVYAAPDQDVCGVDM